ncbi:hypothetical protein SKAU_G00137300 [Synaphobranchus kaupii]|uniref:Uncharacterized protein n=1 Tax=Synaphobranchus kaupii TaxID=118154 RepID=A0A9Q1FRU5_SYNKA|nr:hypothetical protein SKAU_G00137300 [Synaphobranchus kaupii]
MDPLVPNISESTFSSNSKLSCAIVWDQKGGKRKRENHQDLLEYLERADERFMQHSRELNEAILTKTDEVTCSLLGIMGRMVAVMERQQS